MPSKLLIALFCWVSLSVSAQTVNLTSSNLPIVVINTNNQSIPSEPKITASMGIIYNGAGVRNNISDPYNHYNGAIGIEVRGQSSQSFPMKSYSIELRDALGNSQDLSMLDMPKESDWVLYAPFTDKTLMRNVLAYHLSRSLGHWAARTRFVELIVNNDYKGVYVFEEKIKRVNARVGVTKMSASDVSGDAVTGGYIFSLDKQPNGWFSKYATPNSSNGAKRQFSYIYPKPGDIATQQMAYIESAVDKFESSLAADNFQDPYNGVRKYADIPSFIDYLIVNEVSRNVDGYRLSTYLHKDRDSKNPRIIAGPVWDYDLAFRNADYCSGSNVEGWAYMFNYVCPGDGAGLIPFWWQRFMQQDTAFQAALYCRWKEVRKTLLSNDRLFAVIDSAVNVVNEAKTRHFQRWPILGTYVWPNPQPIAGSYPQEIEYLKSWLNSRLYWLDNNMPNTGTCYDYPKDIPQNILVTIAPNPMPNTGIMQVASRSAQTLDFSVTDMMGRQIMRQRVLLNPGLNNIRLDAFKWARGVYFIQMVTNNGDKVARRIVH